MSDSTQVKSRTAAPPWETTQGGNIAWKIGAEKRAATEGVSVAVAAAREYVGYDKKRQRRHLLEDLPTADEVKLAAEHAPNYLETLLSRLGGAIRRELISRRAPNAPVRCELLVNEGEREFIQELLKLRGYSSSWDDTHALDMGSLQDGRSNQVLLLHIP